MYIMATFNESGHIHDDACDRTQRSVQNAAAANYMLSVPRPEQVGAKAVTFATAQPSVTIGGSHGTAPSNTNVTHSSELLHTRVSRPACKLNLQTRAFTSVPYLGRGQGDAVSESRLQQGERQENRKTSNPASETCFSAYQHTPLLPTLEATVTNPTHLVESSASKGWVRGGVPSRELTRDTQHHASG